MPSARRTAAIVSVLIAATSVASPATAAATPPPAALSNLAHLDFLTDTVAPPLQPGHST